VIAEFIGERNTVNELGHGVVKVRSGESSVIPNALGGRASPLEACQNLPEKFGSLSEAIVKLKNTDGPGSSDVEDGLTAHFFAFTQYSDFLGAVNQATRRQHFLKALRRIQQFRRGIGHGINVQRGEECDEKIPFSFCGCIKFDLIKMMPESADQQELFLAGEDLLGTHKKCFTSTSLVPRDEPLYV
jgi:hypothetical protein